DTPSPCRRRQARARSDTARPARRRATAEALSPTHLLRARTSHYPDVRFFLERAVIQRAAVGRGNDSGRCVGRIRHRPGDLVPSERVDVLHHELPALAEVDDVLMIWKPSDDLALGIIIQETRVQR